MFLGPDSADISGGVVSRGEGLSCARHDVQRGPGFHLPMSVAPHLPGRTIDDAVRHCHMSSGGRDKTALVQNSPEYLL